MQGDNLNDRLRERGVRTPGKVLRAYDVNVPFGGPIVRDRLWFFVSTRFQGTKNQVPGQFFNKTQGTPFFTPDLDRPQFRKDWLKSQAVRLTWQISERNKLAGFADPQHFMTRGTGPGTAPEAHTCWFMWPQGTYQVSWTSPVTSRLLLEAGAGLTKGPFPCTRENVTDVFDFVVSPTDVAITESSTGFRYNARSYRPRNDHDRYVQRFAGSYVTGSHAFKAGFQLQQHVHNQLDEYNMDQQWTFNQGVPTRIRQWATPYLQKNRTKADLGIYVQDQWTIDRLSLNYGLRFDYFNGYVPAQQVPATRFVPERNFDAVNDVPEWTDLDPRVGASYDLFGDGRTALKASLGRYVGRETTVFARANNPIATSINRADRSWSDANENFVPDCDLTDFGGKRRMRGLEQCEFRQAQPQRRHDGRRPAPWVRESGVLLGLDDGSATRAPPRRVAAGWLLPQLE